MTDTEALQRLIAASVADPRREPEFLRALLTATLYLHIAGADRATGTRVIQFDRPDGIRVTPVFTTAERAHVAAGGVVGVGAMIGRELLVATRGHVLMLDPNDTSCTLYPEEIEALLTGGAMQAPSRYHDEGAIAAVDSVPTQVGPAAIAAVAPIDAIESLTLARLGGDRYLLIAGVPKVWEERAARAIALALRAHPASTGEVNFTTFDPTSETPGWYADAGLTPFWTRNPVPALH